MMSNFQYYAYKIADVILTAYHNSEFSSTNKNDLIDELNTMSYEIILDWVKLCSEEKYNELVDNPDVYENIYDAAFDRAVKAAVTLIYG